MQVADILRERFVEVNEEYKRYSSGKKYAEISKIRIETPLLDGVGQYTIDIKKQITGNKREVSLDRNDVFVPNTLGIFLALQSETKPSTEILMPFPAIADGTNPSVHEIGFKTRDIFALYNGKLVWNVDNGVLMGSYPTERFLKVPEKQGATVVVGSEVKQEQVLPQWDIDACSDLLLPKLTIAGTRDHQITINFDASGLSFDCTEGYKPVLVFYMGGFLVKGGCEFYDAKNPNASAIGQW